jgi:hypothetical protein
VATLIFVLRLVNLIAAAIVAGGQIYVFRVVMPVKRRFDTRRSVEVHNAMLGHQTDHYMKPAGIISFMAALAIVALTLLGPSGTYPAVPWYSTLFMCLGMLGTFGVAVLSRYCNVPTNAKMLTWDLDRIPDDYPQIRARWDLVHTGRVTCGSTAFVGYLLGALTARL